ncbi:MAG: hypothetical protein ABIK78_01815 [candidate division WOR-3 bacterium]
MRNFIFLLVPLFIFSYYDFSLRKDAFISELLEDPYTDYYFNPAFLAELKGRFIGCGIYGNNEKTQFAYLNFLNPNKLLPYALIFTNFETEFSSEKGITFLFSRKRKDYSYGFKFQIGEIRNFYETLLNYKKSEFNLEQEGPVGDSSSEDFYFEDYYSLEKRDLQQFSYYQNKSALLLCPLAFYLKFKSLDVGIDFKNSLEKRIFKEEREEKKLEIEEEYEYRKEGDTLLRELEEYLSSDVEFDNYRSERIDTLNIWNKDISLFLRKKIKGIREKKIFFTRLGYSFEITKGNTYQKSFDSTYEIFLEWEKSYDGYWDCESLFYEEGKSVKNETKAMIKEKKENFYQEGGFGFNYYFSLLKLDNTIFLGIKEKIDLIKKEKEWDKKGKVYFYLGNNFEKGGFSFFPIFIPYFTIEEDTISYNYQWFFDLKLKLFDFLNCRFSYLLPAEKEAYKKWVLSLYLNY